MTQGHPGKRLLTPRGYEADIDVEIVPFIWTLWDLGIETFNSCQDNFGYVWFQTTPDGAARFLTIIARHGDKHLSYMALEPVDLSPTASDDEFAGYHRERPTAWLIGAGTWYDDECDYRPVVVELSISIRFPREHLSRVMAALPKIVD